MAGGGGGEGEADSLEYTPTWIVALHLKRKNQKPLFEALQKIKEELMLLGLISLLLTVFQTTISKICIRESWTNHLLPCNKDELKKVAHVGFTSGIIGRKLLPSGGNNEYCTKKGKVPLLSSEALHQLHIFIFVLAIVHITFCVFTILFGGIKLRTWKQWEDFIAKDKYDTVKHLNRVTHVQENAFIKDHFLFLGEIQHSNVFSFVISLQLSFFKQFYGSTHCRGNPKFDFHKYMVRALEADFKKVYLWIFVVVFLLLNLEGWNTYFWITFVPLLSEDIISQLAHEVAEKHVAIEGDLVVKPSDEHFWFSPPVLFSSSFISSSSRMLLKLHFASGYGGDRVKFLLFNQIQVEFGFNSCIMGQVHIQTCTNLIVFVSLRVFIQVLCSYSTLLLYAIVAQFIFNKAIFDEHVQQGLVGWAEKARKRGLRSAAANGSTQGGSHQGRSKEGSSTAHILMGRMRKQQETAKEDSDIALISPKTRQGEP
ncbi:hypothetical protein MKX01_029379 [Papaver californicum]|nr:hypothetical protein MKX01_029379 [Papaver californicum]